jgi:colicin import membrane protein
MGDLPPPEPAGSLTTTHANFEIPMSTTTQAPEVIDGQIQKIVNESGLSNTLADNLVHAFGPPFAEASAIVAESRQIHVTDATQLTEMKSARTARHKLREIRTAAEKQRKAMKEDSLRMGKAIDNVAKTIALLTEPEEARLEECEKFAERAEAARKASLKAAREQLLRPFNIDTGFYDLGSMPEATFANLLESTRIAHEAKIAAAKKAEDERLAAEQARRDEEARIRAENERLRAEREAQEKAAQAERAKAEAERKAIEAKHAAERKAADDKARAEREAAEAKLRAEREAREKLEREQREREQAEAQRKAAEARAAKKAAAAPDAEKLRAWGRMVKALPPMAMATAEGTAAVMRVEAAVKGLLAEIEREARKLEDA